AVEAVVDQTEIMKAQRRFKKISEYQSKEVETLNAILDRMAEGDLTVTYQPVEPDEDTSEIAASFKEISESLNETLDNLNNILSNVTVAVDQVSTGSQQVSSASQSLSEGSTEQASSIEETSSSMEEIGSQTRQNAANAEEANKLTAEARLAADTGNQSMQKMIEAMKEIKDSSTEVSKIIKVIDEIAFQTNLLSLNAAVEAARAGIHGKGFAVVADEVRNLAQRSAKAAKETTEMIEGSMTRVLAGSEIALKTGDALEEIVSSIAKATALVNEITDASRRQATGIEQINDALTQIDSVTQSNTANAEESAAAAEELSSQATQLSNTVRKFKLRDSSRNYAHIPARGVANREMERQNQSIAKGVVDSGNGKRSRLPIPQQIIELDDDEFSGF
ncbi:methyl-accepting chemotaxis protein, partial [bacterium]|nr:methyl-accepting chemotaxis protein [bacterium]